MVSDLLLLLLSAVGWLYNLVILLLQSTSVFCSESVIPTSAMFSHLLQPRCFSALTHTSSSFRVYHGDSIINKYTDPRSQESLFSLTQMVLMLSWGRASDRFGRKPVLASSLFGCGICISFFGLSRSVWQMILFRCLAGVFSGTVV